MNFSISITEQVNNGIKRIIIEQIEDAVSRLSETNNNFDIAIHETRKDFKKIRAVIRMVRFELGQELYKRENIFFRDTGRLLSRIRDAAAMAEALEKLFNNHKNEISLEDYKRLRTNLKRRALGIKNQFKRNKKLIEGIRNLLGKHIDEVRAWGLTKEDFTLIEDGIKQVYQRGLNGIAEIGKNPSAHNFHEWRKRVKYLWYIVKILNEAWIETMTPLSDKLDILSDYLGDEHDLAELRELLIRDTALFGDEVKQVQFLNVLGMERLELQSRAKSLIGYIYNESADEFVHRIKSYWEQSKHNFNHPVDTL